MVPEVGIEPTRGEPRWILSPVLYILYTLVIYIYYFSKIAICSNFAPLKKNDRLIFDPLPMHPGQLQVGLFSYYIIAYNFASSCP